jgi:anti-sigma regulatory factor (Ser/Thr protein kinase)
MGDTEAGQLAREFSRELTAQTCDYAELRQQFGAWLASFGVERTTVEDWRLILTELATNACEAAPPDAVISCRATCNDNRIELCVSNPVVDGASIEPATSFDPGATRGAGLFIVDAIVHGITYDIDADVVTIRCWTPVQRY